MSKYARLGDFLREQGRESVPMTFAEIERIVGVSLPKSQKHQAWWSNSTSNNVMTKVWLDAGYRTEQVDIAHGRLVFRRVAAVEGRGAPRTTGMRQEPSMFRSDTHVTPPDGKLARHPAFGALKGKFTIAPGTDLTAPVYSDEEWAEIEKEMEADWDEIERGMSGRT
jgi:hypothetical protein